MTWSNNAHLLILKKKETACRNVLEYGKVLDYGKKWEKYHKNFCRGISALIIFLQAINVAIGPYEVINILVVFILTVIPVIYELQQVFEYVTLIPDATAAIKNFKGVISMIDNEKIKKSSQISENIFIGILTRDIRQFSQDAPDISSNVQELIDEEYKTQGLIIDTDVDALNKVVVEKNDAKSRIDNNVKSNSMSKEPSPKSDSKLAPGSKSESKLSDSDKKQIEFENSIPVFPLRDDSTYKNDWIIERLNNM